MYELYKMNKSHLVGQLLNF